MQVGRGKKQDRLVQAGLVTCQASNKCSVFPETRCHRCVIPLVGSHMSDGHHVMLLHDSSGEAAE